MIVNHAFDKPILVRITNHAALSVGFYAMRQHASDDDFSLKPEKSIFALRVIDGFVDNQKNRWSLYYFRGKFLWFLREAWRPLCIEEEL